MSLASKVTLGASLCATVGIIYYVQAKQQEDIKKMHEGVIRDKERQQRRKIENVYMLEQQAQLKNLLKNQNRDNEVVIKLLEGETESGK